MSSNLIFSKLQQLLQKRAEQSASVEALVGGKRYLFTKFCILYKIIKNIQITNDNS